VCNSRVNVDEVTDRVGGVVSDRVDCNEDSVLLQPVENGGVWVGAFFISEIVFVVRIMHPTVTRCAVFCVG